MPRSGPRTVRRYSDEFKVTAVRLSQQPGIQVQTVASALAIHPFMLSKWRKDAREGRLRGRAPKAPAVGPARELAQAAAARAGVCAAQRGARPLKKSHPVLFRSKRRHVRVHRARAGRVRRETALSALRRHGRRVLRVAAARRQRASEAGPDPPRRNRAAVSRPSRAVRQPAVVSGDATRGVARQSTPHRATHARGRAAREGGPRLPRQGEDPSPSTRAIPNRVAGLAPSVGPIKCGWATSRICASAEPGAISRSCSTSTRDACSPGRSRAAGRRR